MTYDDFLFLNTNKRRERSQILHDLLIIAKDGERKTRIMYSARISWQPMIKMFKFAEAAGLIEEIEAPRHKRHYRRRPNIIWRTTPKGLTFANNVYKSYRLLQGSIMDV